MPEKKGIDRAVLTKVIIGASGATTLYLLLPQAYTPCCLALSLIWSCCDTIVGVTIGGVCAASLEMGEAKYEMDAAAAKAETAPPTKRRELCWEAFHAAEEAEDDEDD